MISVDNITVANNLAALMDSIKADHGFNMDSKSVKNLLQTMSELTLTERRDFLQFTTGSPKLPIGGTFVETRATCQTLTKRQASRLLPQCSQLFASQVSHLTHLMTTSQVS